jgi:hypothetical protein
MPFHLEHGLFEAAEKATRKADCTPKRNRQARRNNHLAAEQAHLAAARAYRKQTTDDWAGGSYLPEVTTRSMGKLYAKIHAEQAQRQHQLAEEYK